jgi:phosphotransferase system enzyme I (PtsI)
MAKQVLVGAGVGSGIARGPAFVLYNHSPETADADDITGERAAKNIKDAIDVLAKELESKATTGASADVLNALAAILRDPVLMESIRTFLEEGSGAERAVRGAFNGFGRQLEKLGGYFAERASDLADLSVQLIDRLKGRAGQQAFPDHAFVLVATELSPILAAGLKGTKAIGVITEKGSATSHSAIITRSANLPTVMGVVGSEDIVSGQELIIDATSGQVFVEPTAEEADHYKEAAYPSTAIMEKIPTADDLPVTIMANLGSAYEVVAAHKSGASGVGLYRTELLYLGQTEAPSKAAQMFEYTKLLAGFAGERVVVRVLDIDVDKPLPFLKTVRGGKYSNRGLRVLLANPEILRTQLEALAQAHQYYPNTDLWVMAPMVVTVGEAKKFVKMAHAAGLKKVGIMVEVPEIAKPRTIRRVLKFVDFLSIGTNDLTQYALGKSRYASALPLSEARNFKVLQIIDEVMQAAKEAGKPVGVCGEAASDPISAKVFIAMGVESLSASPSLIPQLASALDEWGWVPNPQS